MSAPSKPWENQMRFQNPLVLSNADAGYPSRLVMPRPVSSAPPLPPRTRGGYSAPGLMSRYSPYGGGYGSYGGYSGYGGYGSYGYNPYSMRQMDFENRFVQMAEESAAPAFESIDGFIRGFSSISMMLESTFQAMHMSFRAILAVGENMSKMKAAVVEFLSALAVLKVIYAFYRKILRFLGLVNGAEVSWKEAESIVSGRGQSTAVARKSYWPMLAFLGTVIAGPWLMYRMLPPGDAQDEDVDLIGVHDFDSEQAGELSFRKGERMTAKKSGLKKAWIMVQKGSAKGLVPYNRVAMLRKKGEAPPAADPSLVEPTSSSLPPESAELVTPVLPESS